MAWLQATGLLVTLERGGERRSRVFGHCALELPRRAFEWQLWWGVLALGWGQLCVLGVVSGCFFLALHACCALE